MSWPFGGRNRVYVGTQVTRMVEDNLLSELGSSGSIKAILQGSPVGLSIVDEILAGFGTKVERAFNYAKTDYTYGLPNHTFLSDTVGLNEAKAIFSAAKGGAISLEYHHFGVLNPIHVGLQKAVDSYGYNPTTNELEWLSASVGYTCYLNTVVGYIRQAVSEITDNSAEGDEFVTPSADKMVTWDRDINDRYLPWINPYKEDPNWVFHPSDPDTVKLVYSYASDVPRIGTQAETLLNAWEAAKTQALAVVVAAETQASNTLLVADTLAASSLRLTYELGIALDRPVTDIEDFVINVELDLNLNGLSVEKGYFQSKYDYDLNGNRRTQYFTYEHGKGTYPTLDQVTTNAQIGNEFMPFIFLRDNDQDLTNVSNAGSEPYDSTNALCKKLDLNYSDFGDAINENPDVGKINQAFLLWAVPANTHLEEGKKYLYKFFEWLYLNESTMNVQYGSDSYSGIGSTQYTDSTTVLASTSTNRSVTLEDANFRMQLNYGGLSKQAISGRISVVSVPATDTTGEITALAEIGQHNSEVVIEQVDYQVRQATVVNNENTFVLVTVTKDVPIYVYREQLTLNTYSEIRVAGLNLVYRMDAGDVTINTDEDAGRLLIPLNHTLVDDNFSAIDRDRLYAQSFHTVFNTKVTKRLAWYETSFFQGLLIVFAVVITVISLGNAAPAVAQAYATYAATYGVILGAVLTALELVAINYLQGQVLQLVVKEIGGEEALIISAIAMIAGNYAAIKNIDFAPNLLAVATGLANAGSNQITADTTQYLIDSAQFAELAEERFGALDAIDAQFALSSFIDPLELIGREPLHIMGETPDEFYNRTVHAGNIGVGSYEYISNYVDNAVQLPTFDRTMRGQF